MRPTVAVVAAEEPEIAANIVQPSTLTWSSRPGSRVVHGASPVKSEADRREWNRISAIRMKRRERDELRGGGRVPDELREQLLDPAGRGKMARPASPGA